ncbi:MAG: prepilin-type N-terminal cleavage/methylation domain-containing protein [Desulfobacteraceae bacterium]|nr:prepilin-type N-terminal cleavage/methylation domain-containing protein [Desulfobacteraceae bacterium]
MSVRNPLLCRKAFTLIELIVVVSLISVMMFFAVPRMHGTFFSDDSRKFSSWLLANVRNLKTVAVEKQTAFALYVDLDRNQIWKAPASLEEEDFPDLEDSNRRSLPKGHSLTDVMFSEGVRETDGVARIYFYPRGYSDRAIIHIRENDGSVISYRIESFLPRVEIVEGHEEF